jgi:metal-responsive CopG/Arc/MetJ family transcriptional regulator
MVRIPPDLLAALDAWMAVRGLDSRPEAVRRILKDTLG